jgi:biotin transport system substrate-specific component
MQINTAAENYFRIRYGFFKWRSECSLPVKIILASGGACLIGALAQLKIFLPWTPVPVTGQNLGVLITGVMLGRWWGGISTVIYITLGAAVIPWFAGFSGGPSVLLGPTGGYFIGFIIASLFMGYVTDNFRKYRKLPYLIGIMIFAQVVLIYTPGLIQLDLWFNMFTGKPATIIGLLWMGAIPFIPGDLLKAVAGSLIIHGITTEKPY